MAEIWYDPLSLAVESLYIIRCSGPTRTVSGGGGRDRRSPPSFLEVEGGEQPWRRCGGDGVSYESLP